MLRFGTLWKAVAISVVAVIFFTAIMPWIRAKQHEARRSECHGRMSQIALALHYYHDEFGDYPPFVQRAADRRPLYSWRMLIAKHFRPDLADRFDPNVAWNESPNREIVAEFGRDPAFQCPVDDDLGAPSLYALRWRQVGNRRELLLVESDREQSWAAPDSDDGLELPDDWRNKRHGEFSQYLVLNDALGKLVQLPNDPK